MAAPAPVASTGRIIPAIAPPLTSQFQSQDEFGNLAYGYANPNSAKQEVGNTYGGVTGSYSYTDANGIVQTVNYIADGLGFRVQATNLPVAPVAELAQPIHEYTLPVAPVANLEQPIHEYVLPVAPEDTPEVAEAKAAHLALLAAAGDRKKRSTPAATAILPAATLPAALPYAGLPYAGLPYAGLAGLPYAGLAGLPYGGYAGYPYAAGLPLAAPAATVVAAAPAPVAAAPVVAPALATRDAVKLIIKNNPGFAESYIVQ